MGEIQLLRTARLGVFALALAWLLLIDVYALRLIAHGFARGYARNNDFTVFWTAARVPLRDVYDAAALTAAEPHGPHSTGLMPFAYPPTFLPVIAPLRLLPYWAAYIAWVGLGVVAYFAAASRLWPRPALALVAISPAFLLTIQGGQTSLLVGALVLGGFSLLRQRPANAGALLALAALIKPQTVILVPIVLLAAREWRALGACLIVGVAGGLASALVLGPAPWLAWSHSLGGFLEVVRDGGSLPHGATPATLAMQLGLSDTAALILRVVLAALGLAVAVVAGLKRAEPRLMAVAMVACGLLVSPYGMSYDLAVLWPFAALLVTDRRLSIGLAPVGALALSHFFLTPLVVLALVGCVVVKFGLPGLGRQAWAYGAA